MKWYIFQLSIIVMKQIISDMTNQMTSMGATQASPLICSESQVLKTMQHHQTKKQQFLEVTNFSVWNLQEYFRPQDQTLVSLTLAKTIIIAVLMRKFRSRCALRLKNRSYKQTKSKIVVKRNHLAFKNSKDLILILPCLTTSNYFLEILIS